MASSSSSNPAINLLECSSEELAKYLLEHRFENDGMATTAFLLEGTTALPNADAIADQIMGNGNENDNENRKKKDQQVNIVSSRSEEEPPSALLGESLHSKPFELSLTNPRGKFNVTFHHDGIQAVTVKNPQTLSIPAGAVRDMIVFPKPQDCQKVVKASNASATSPMVLICFQENDDNKEGEDAAEGVTFKGKPLSQICFSLPTTLEGLQDAISQLEECEDATNVESTWIQLLQHSLNIQDNKVYRIVNPAQKNVHTKNGQWSFQSHQEANTSTTSGGMPFVKCYYGVQDGALYPMQQGLLFFK